jgi:hypothetical protein
LNPVQSDLDDAANRRLDAGEAVSQRFESSFSDDVGLAASVETKDQGFACKGTEHQADPAIFSQVGVGFDAATSEIDIRQAIVSEDLE